MLIVTSLRIDARIQYRISVGLVDVAECEEITLTWCRILS